MTKEEFIELLQKDDVDLKTIAEGNYIFTINVGDMSKDEVQMLCLNFEQKLMEFGVKNFLIIPTFNGEGLTAIYKVEDGELVKI